MIEAAETALRFSARRKRADIDTDDQLRFALVPDHRRGRVPDFPRNAGGLARDSLA
jgi:hypothetical protein